MRRALFAWYPFQKNAELLEIDADYGALTGLFCDKCAKVVATESSLRKAKAIKERYKGRNNLQVYAGALEDFDYRRFENRFDYIVLYNVLERKGYGYGEQKAYLEYLDLVKMMLKPHGKILAVVNNRHGIRYFCGARDPYTGIPFDGINKYPNGTKAYAFEKNELEELLVNADMPHYKFFYPLPDARFPQMIYTDSHMVYENISERMTFYDIPNDTLIARERCLYKDFMKSGVFGYFANSFLVEIVIKDENTKVEYAIISSDRGSDRSFATVVYAEKVTKNPIYWQGKATAALCVNNIRELKNNGIRIVPHELNNGNIIMPKIEAETLSTYLKKIAFLDEKKFIALFDQLYDNILNSSEYISEEYDRIKGPILRKCYFDMTPVNCFYYKNELIFFDQEFVRENYYAKYTLYRGIKYTYMSMWELEQKIPQNVLKRRYQLDELWDEFEAEEAKFIEKVRNRKVNGQLENWSEGDEQKIYIRVEQLERVPENKVSDPPVWLKKVQTVQLRILKYVQDICIKHDIRYWLFYGSLLGAVRHRGMIPWDDDIDIVMMREDYERFLTIAFDEIDSPYFLQTMRSDPKCYFGGYAKLRYNDSTAMNVYDYNSGANQGIAIDILPLDYAPLENECPEFYEELRNCHKLLYAEVYEEGRECQIPKEKMREQWNKIAEYTHERLCDLLDEKIRSTSDKQNVAILSAYSEKQYTLYPRCLFEKIKTVPFEDDQVSIPEDYKSMLEKMYGKGYMQIPEKEAQKFKHNLFYNADVPYKKYYSRFEGIIDAAKDKQYIIVGTSELADTFIDQNRMKLSILCIADNNKSGTMFWGYPVKKIEEIKDVPREKRKIVICERYFRATEKMLQEAGIDDYYIYIHDKWWLLGNNE